MVSMRRLLLVAVALVLVWLAGPVAGILPPAGVSRGAMETTCNGRPVTIMGTDGDDVLVGVLGDDVIHGQGGNDIIIGGGNYSLFGLAGLDTICGGDGDDLIYSPLANNYIDGGAGTDVVSYDGAAGAVAVNLALAIAVKSPPVGFPFPFLNTDNLINVEGAIGSSFGGGLVGNAGANLLQSYTNNETVDGGPGDDRCDSAGAGTVYVSCETVGPIDWDGDGYPDLVELAMRKAPNRFCRTMRADVNHDGAVTIADLAAVAARFLQPASTQPRLDQNADGQITIADLSLVASVFLQQVADCP
jgi:Ca2+-binding RTX toxin-like protein